MPVIPTQITFRGERVLPVNYTKCATRGRGHDGHSPIGGVVRLHDALDTAGIEWPLIVTDLKITQLNEPDVWLAGYEYLGS